MNQRWNALLKGLAAIGAVIIICISIGRFVGIGAETLGDIAREYPQPTPTPRAAAGTPQPSPTPQAVAEAFQPSLTPQATAGALQPSPTPGGAAGNSETFGEHTETAAGIPAEMSTPLAGLSLNGELMADARITWEDGFYYEPLSRDLADYITGISYPASLENPAITVDELSYVHVFYRNFGGNPMEGELICNQSIAQDLVEIFYELYKAEYQIEKIQLIDTYDGNDDLSMADNNTSCFNYRVVSGSSSLSRHAYGLAVDINPLYNPYITYNKDQSVNVSPAAGEDYADRSKSFPYKIDEDDLCCRLFKEHGFIWGGNWNSCKDYQHFQKTP